MQTEGMTLVTVVAEAILEHRLVRDVASCGSRGWTVCEARGQGSRGIRAAEFEGANIRLETLVPSPVADRLLEILSRDYFPHYAAVAWTTPVEVARAGKYA